MAKASFNKDEASIGFIRSAFLGIGPRNRFQLKLDISLGEGSTFFSHLAFGKEISDLFNKLGLSDAEGYKAAFEGRQCYVRETSMTGEFLDFVEEKSSQAA
jgi:hypothetical protein